MATLTVKLLGPLRVELDGRPITDFKTNKVRGLLAYLAAEAERPIGRQVLAGILWPEFGERRARANLSQALFTLRRCIGDDSREGSFLVVDRNAIQFCSDSRLWVDVHEFSERVQSNRRASTQRAIGELEAAVALYEGEFLEGFSVQGSPAFEMWCLMQRERMHRHVSDSLIQLIAFYERASENHFALSFARRLVNLDNWREEAHAILMRLLACTGQRSEALAQYETCRQLLSENLGIAPSRQTKALYDAIRSDQLITDGQPAGMTPVGTAVAAPFMNLPRGASPQVVCVGRDTEIARLELCLEDTLGGQGHIIFVVGEAGSGKTVLANAFASQMTDRYPQLLVASGKGTAYTGMGDPYGAFRSIASQLVGDVSTEWAAGTISRAQALRLWRAVPTASEALVRDAPGLIDTFVDGPRLLERATQYVHTAQLTRQHSLWLNQLEALVEGGGGGSGSQGQTALFEQYARFLTALSCSAPLLLFLDDLQWADVGTISLLFHIIRNLGGQRLLLVGAYRPEETMDSWDGRRHPLASVVHESQETYGDVLLELGRGADPVFVEAFVDSEPNCLDPSFRTKLLTLTGGHALYTVELLRGLQERGDLRKDSAGRWISGKQTDWNALPPRIEGVIAERIDRLPQASRQLLQAACVQGETFIAEVAAEVLSTEEGPILSTLGNELSSDHRLVWPHRLERTADGRERISSYQFRHILFQKYLYDHLDPVAKARLHEATGEALSGRFGEGPSTVAAQLARHFEAAGILGRAVASRLQAGNYAIKLAANQEAAEHFSHGLEMLSSMPSSIERDEQELALQLGLGTAQQLKDGYGSVGAQQAYGRALELCGQLGESPQLVAALWPLATYAAMTGSLQQALSLAEQAVTIAKRGEDPLFLAVAHHHLGWILYHHGRFTESVAHQQVTIDLYDRQFHEPMIQMFGHDFGVTSLGWSAWPLVLLGHVDQALQRCHEAIALAQEFDHPFSLVHAYGMTAHVHDLRGESAKSSEFGERMLELATAYGFSTYVAAANYPLGSGLIGKGQFAQGLARWWKQLELLETGGVKLYHRGSLAAIARVLVHLGQLDQAQDALHQADSIGYRDFTDYLLKDAQGQLLIAQGCAPEKAEACFLQGIRAAERQKAKWPELQLTTSLASLWQSQGRRQEAHDKLAAIIGWFTEGFETPIYQMAEELLSDLT